MTKAIIFDVDGVLIDSFQANLKFYRDLMIHAGYTPPTKKQFLTMFHMTMTDVIGILTKSHDEKEIKKIWLMGKNREVRYPDELITIPDGLKTVIKKLRKRHILGIATSRIRGGVFTLPQLTKFQSYFKGVVYYEDTIKHKPDPEPLLLAAINLGVKPRECVYIGDAPTDVTASKAAGMRVIIYSKKRIPDSDDWISVFAKIPQSVIL